MIMPCPGADFKYLKTSIVASQCPQWGSCMNWLRICTEYVNYGLVIVRLMSRPTNLRYFEGSSYKRLESNANLWFGASGRDAGLQASIPHSFSMSKVYFLWHMNNPEGPRTCSRPRKYFSPPKSLMWKHSLRYCLNFTHDFASFPATIRSST